MIKILVTVNVKTTINNLFILLFKELYQVSKIIDKYVQEISVVELYAVWVNHCSCAHSEHIFYKLLCIHFILQNGKIKY